MFLVDYKSVLKRLNGVCTKALEQGAALAIGRGHYEVALPHLLLHLLQEERGDVFHIFKKLAVAHTPLQRALTRGLDRRPSGNSGKPVFSPLLIQWMQDAWLLGSVEGGAAKVRSGHLLAVLLQQPEAYEAADYADLLRPLHRDQVRGHLAELTEGSVEVPVVEAAPAGEAGAAPGAPELGDESALGRYTLDLTQRAREGHIDPVLGRDREVRQMVDILLRRQKNNPIIVGESGVGKTALVEGLALRIAAGDVPAALREVAVRSLDLGLLQAGAGVKGEFESRITAVIGEVKASTRPIILFIDEAHTLIGAGAQAGSTDAANLLKPALARGELRTVAATTWSEYKKYFEKDPALSRRFQVVKVDEPSPEAAKDMLRGLSARFAKSHGVHVRDDAVEAAVELSSRYISGRLLPDKAVDLLDTCCARVKVAQGSMPADLEALQRRVESLQRRQAARREDLRLLGEAQEGDAVLAELAAQAAQVEEQRGALQGRWEAERQAAEEVLRHRVGKDGVAGADTDAEAVRGALAGLQALRRDVPLVPVEVDPHVVAAVVADWTGIPVGKMVRDDIAAVTRIEESLGRRIRGQDAAIGSIARRLRNARAGLQDPRQPLGVFLLVGPSGTGKTETALSVADLIFGGERFMTTINMSEFQEKHTVSRLIGSPPGYVGFGEGGVLTEAVRQRPYSVVLLDEVEKADPEVLNLFYQVFDKGMLADGEGRVVDFKNTVVFMTSNLGSDVTMGLAARSGGELPVDELGKALRPLLNKHFKPALLARMTLVPYLPIGSAVLREIVELKLGQVAARMRQSHKVELRFGDAVLAAVAARCQEAETGARNVDHIVREQLLPVLASHVLQRLAEGELAPELEVSLTEAGGFAVGPAGAMLPQVGAAGPA